MRHTEPARSVGAVDRIGAVESGVCQKHVETLTMLHRYRFDIPSDCIEQRESRLSSNGISETVPVLPQETPVNNRP
jgi:hypothetical protein